MFITTELWIQDYGYENAKKVFETSMEKLYSERLMDLCVNAKVVPTVDQVEIHPFFQQVEAMENMKELGV